MAGAVPAWQQETPLRANGRSASASGTDPRRQHADSSPAVATKSNRLELPFPGGAPSEQIQEAGSCDQEVPSQRERYSGALVQHSAGPSGASLSLPPPGHAPAHGPGGSGPDLPAGNHRPIGFGRAVDRDSGPGAGRLQDLAADPALSGRST